LRLVGDSIKVNRPDGLAVMIDAMVLHRLRHASSWLGD
jgi:hypothetical protein